MKTLSLIEDCIINHLSMDDKCDDDCDRDCDTEADHGCDCYSGNG